MIFQQNSESHKILYYLLRDSLSLLLLFLFQLHFYTHTHIHVSIFRTTRDNGGNNNDYKMLK